MGAKRDILSRGRSTFHYFCVPFANDDDDDDDDRSDPLHSDRGVLTRTVVVRRRLTVAGYAHKKISETDGGETRYSRNNHKSWIYVRRVHRRRSQTSTTKSFTFGWTPPYGYAVLVRVCGRVLR